MPISFTELFNVFQTHLPNPEERNFPTVHGILEDWRASWREANPDKAETLSRAEKIYQNRANMDDDEIDIENDLRARNYMLIEEDVTLDQLNKIAQERDVFLAQQMRTYLQEKGINVPQKINEFIKERTDPPGVSGERES